MSKRKVLGLILELNPPHNGHKYFIDKAKELINPDYIVAVISSNFSMRGDIMVLDKFSKTNIALEMGIDLIIELPTVLACSSADYFAYNAVNLLSKLNVTDIVFGAECNSIDDLNKLSNIITTTEYNLLLKDYLDKGFSYNTSSNKALSSFIDNNDLINQFSLPNNTLGIQYINAIKKINPLINYSIIKRINNNYFDENITGKISSATSIRNLIKDNKSVNNYVFSNIYPFINLNNAYNNLFSILKYNLLFKDKSELKEILGVNEGIESRLINIINTTNNYDEFINNAVTKRYTINKIKRILINIILGIKEKSNICYNNTDLLIRVLGFNSKGKKYISLLPKDVKQNIITTLKNVDNNIYNIELKSTILYGIITNNTQIYKQEYNIPIRSEENDN